MFADRLVRFLLDDLDSEVASAAAQTDRNPTKDEKESGDYEKGEITVHGLDIEIENAKGSTRSGEHDGKAWSVKMPAVYGYFVRVDGQKAPKGKDKDEIDVYIGPDAETETVFVVNQNKEEGGFDEHKVLMGFATKEEAVKVYDNAFSCDLGPKLRDSVATFSMADFKEWLKTGNKKQPIKTDMSEATQIVETLLETAPGLFSQEAIKMENLQDLAALGHGTYLGSCGHVVRQCRCPHGAELTFQTSAPCQECQEKH